MWQRWVFVLIEEWNAGGEAPSIMFLQRFFSRTEWKIVVSDLVRYWIGDTDLGCPSSNCGDCIDLWCRLKICEILSLRWLPLPTENGSKLQLEWCVGAYSYKYNSNSSLKMAAARIWGQSDKLFHRSRSYVYISNSDFRWTQRSCSFFANEYLKLVSNSIH